MNIREADHKDSGIRTVLAALSSSLYHLQFSPLPEMECGHKIPKHCQRGTTQSLWATQPNSTHLHQLQVKNFMFKGIHTRV